MKHMNTSLTAAMSTSLAQASPPSAGKVRTRAQPGDAPAVPVLEELPAKLLQGCAHDASVMWVLFMCSAL
jgi:hypothetical protein